MKPSISWIRAFRRSSCTAFIRMLESPSSKPMRVFSMCMFISSTLYSSSFSCSSSCQAMLPSSSSTRVRALLSASPARMSTYDRISPTCRARLFNSWRDSSVFWSRVSVRSMMRKSIWVSTLLESASALACSFSTAACSSSSSASMSFSRG